jgi:hypothetical protein
MTRFTLRFVLALFAVALITLAAPLPTSALATATEAKAPKQKKQKKQKKPKKPKAKPNKAHKPPVHRRAVSHRVAHHHYAGHAFHSHSWYRHHRHWRTVYEVRYRSRAWSQRAFATRPAEMTFMHHLRHHHFQHYLRHEGNAWVVMFRNHHTHDYGTYASHAVARRVELSLRSHGYAAWLRGHRRYF